MLSKYLPLRLVCLIAILTSSSYSCAPPRPHPAVSAYQHLIAAFGSGRSDDVWRILSHESRVLLLKRLSSQASENQEHDQQQGDVNHDSLTQAPAQLRVELDWALESPFTAQAKIASSNASGSLDQDPSRFQEVSVFYASQSWLIPAIFEDGAWRIHLLGARPTTSTSPLPHR
jgi:hypothetical protein